MSEIEEGERHISEYKYVRHKPSGKCRKVMQNGPKNAVFLDSIPGSDNRTVDCANESSLEPITEREYKKYLSNFHGIHKRFDEIEPDVINLRSPNNARNK